MDIVLHGIKQVQNQSVRIVKYGAGLVLRRNVELKFKKSKVFGHDNVTVAQVFYKLLINLLFSLLRWPTKRWFKPD